MKVSVREVRRERKEGRERKERRERKREGCRTCWIPRSLSAFSKAVRRFSFFCQCPKGTAVVLPYSINLEDSQGW